MSTRRRIPSKSTEDVGEHRCRFQTKTPLLYKKKHPDSSLFQAAAPLMRYLEQELQYMNENLVKENFNRYPQNSVMLRLYVLIC